MMVAGAVTGAIAAYILGVFSLFTWTWGVADLCPELIPMPLFITAVTAIVFMPIGWLLGFMSQNTDGDGGGDFRSSGFSGGASGSSSPSSSGSSALADEYE